MLLSSRDVVKKRLDDISENPNVVENGSNKTDVIGRRDSSTTVVDAITKKRS